MTYSFRLFKLKEIIKDEELLCELYKINESTSYTTASIIEKDDATMIEQGKIIDISTDKVKIQLDRSSACGSCNACSKMQNGSFIIEALNPGGVEVGQYVTIELPGKVFLQSVMLLYSIPLTGFLLGVVIGYIVAKIFGWVRYKELVSMISGILMLAGTFIVIRNLSEKSAESRMAKIVTIGKK